MGNGFDVPEIVSKYKKIAVVGGGIGTAPMYQLTLSLIHIFAAHHTGHALELVLFGVGRVVGGNGVHDAAADAVHQ